MRKIVLVLVLLTLTVIGTITFLKSRNVEPDRLAELKYKYTKEEKPSVDHSKFEILNKNFTTPQEVTQACLSCHNESDKQVMQSNHWNWERQEYIEGRGIVSIGKKNAINNFCIGVQGNEKSCAKCHIGFGITDKLNGYTDEKNIDCMVCHDNTETYIKANEKGGIPDSTIDFGNIARKIGNPKRTNCGVCHFFGGGGNNVKHGDLEKSMFEPTKDIDVHMATDGPNLACTACHKTEKHVMLGKVYSLSSMNRNRSTCEQCHTETPHKEEILNEHTLKVACQTCHIPVYAKVNSTKTEWDWSTAGRLKNGEPFEEDDSLGNHTYLSIKGSFKWGRNLKPDYVWFNGTAGHYLLGDIVTDTSTPLKLNTLNGSYKDKESKIIPIKIHRAKQPYDPVNKILIQPKLFADSKGEGALWQDFDWIRASEVGMKDVNLPFSGNVSFINSEMYWPVNHMVSSKSKSVKCVECHTRNDSRLASLKDFYMPGRDYSPFIDFSGKGILLISIIGIVLHGAIRVYSSRKKNNKK
jgi:octaheme c-type cytochrome (tetrathionate reductase family)